MSRDNSPVRRSNQPDSSSEHRLVRPDRSPERAQRPEAELFDEVHIAIVPRFKTSHASGDAWRTSVRLQFKQKGTVLHETYHGSLKRALACAPYWLVASNAGHYVTQDDSCDQESCAAPATVTYKLKMWYDRQGHMDDPYKFGTTPVVRKFCAQHAVRGDCNLEDSDRNYELLETVTAPPAAESDAQPNAV